MPVNRAWRENVYGRKGKAKKRPDSTPGRFLYFIQYIKRHKFWLYSANTINDKISTRHKFTRISSQKNAAKTASINF